MTLVQSDNYLVAARVIKDLFQLSPQVVALSLASFAPGNVMLHLLAEVDKESKAKKGIVKLILLYICGNMISRQHWYQTSFQLLHQKECR
jgi:hypothetical protein